MCALLWCLHIALQRIHSSTPTNQIKISAKEEHSIHFLLSNCCVRRRLSFRDISQISTAHRDYKHRHLQSSGLPKNTPFISRMNSLIVDFPSAMTDRSTAKSVRFATKTHGRYIHYPSKCENHAKWNTSEGYKHFQTVMVRDAIRCSAKLAEIRNTPQDLASFQKNIIRCVGLDHLISRNVEQRYHQVKEARRNHVHLVLQVQEWQRRRGDEDPVNLARVSIESSRLFRERSYKVAVLAASVPW